MTRYPAPTRTLAGLLAIAAALLLPSCGPPQRGAAILAATPTSGMIAVSAVGATTVRLLYSRDGGIVMLRTVYLPRRDAVQSVAWSTDERDVLITTSGGLLALDTRTGRLETIPRLAAAGRDDAGASRRR